MDDLFLVGRLVFSGYFLFNGANHFLMNAGGTPMMFAVPRPWPYSLELRRRIRV